MNFTRKVIPGNLTARFCVNMYSQVQISPGLRLAPQCQLRTLGYASGKIYAKCTVTELEAVRSSAYHIRKFQGKLRLSITLHWPPLPG